MGIDVDVRRVFPCVPNKAEAKKYAQKAKLCPLGRPAATSYKALAKLRPITRAELSSIAKLTPSTRHAKLVQLYAQRLHDAGLIGSGTVTFQHLESSAGASAYTQYALITLSSKQQQTRSLREVCEIIIHELLHLSRRIAPEGPYANVDEVTASLLTAAVHHRLHPYLPKRKNFHRGVAYYDEVRTWRALYQLVKPRRNFLDWTWLLHCGDVATLKQTEFALRRRLDPRVKTLLRQLRGRLRTLPEIIKGCANDYHAFCGHTWTDRLLILGTGASRHPKYFPTYFHALMGPLARRNVRYGKVLTTYNMRPFLKK